MDAHEALDRAIGSTRTIVHDVDPASFHMPTPCTEWDVRALLNHLIGDLFYLEGKLTGKPSRAPMAPGGLPERDLLDGDAGGAFEAASQAVLAAARDADAMKREQITAGSITTDVIVHGWDLAKATHQHARFDDDVVEHVLGFVTMGITKENRSPAFGPEIEVPKDAPAIDRLVAFLGRAP